MDLSTTVIMKYTILSICCILLIWVPVVQAGLYFNLFDNNDARSIADTIERFLEYLEICEPPTCSEQEDVFLDKDLVELYPDPNGLSWCRYTYYSLSTQIITSTYRCNQVKYCGYNAWICDPYRYQCECSTYEKNEYVVREQDLDLTSPTWPNNDLIF